MGIDVRLIGAMVVIAYVAYVFIGQALSPIARSRRRARRLQLRYARSIAAVLVLCSLVSVWVPTASLQEGVILALTTAILPMAGVSLLFSALVLKRLHARWRGAGASGDGHRPPVAAPLSLAELQEREERGAQHKGGGQTPSDRLATELDELDEQLGEDRDDRPRQHRDANSDDGAVDGIASELSRQQRA